MGTDSKKQEKKTLRIAGRTFRDARQVCEFIEALCEHSKLKFSTTKRADIFILDLPDFKIEFVPANSVTFINTNTNE